MRLKEGSIMVEGPLTQRSTIDYVRELFTLAHRIPIYVLLRPAVVTVRVSGVLRRIVAAPGSAVLESKAAQWIGLEGLSIEEPAWLDAALLVPLLARPPCTTMIERYGIPVKIDEMVGVPHYCIDETREWQTLKALVAGGLAEVTTCNLETSGRLTAVSTFDKAFMLLKGLGVQFGINANAKVAALNLGPLSVLVEPLVHVGQEPIVAKVGEGYLVSFCSLNAMEGPLYSVILLASHLWPPESPRARAYIEKIGWPYYGEDTETLS